MGMHDRTYWRDEDGGGGGGMGRHIGIGLPKPTYVVKSLLIVNLLVFVLQVFLDTNGTMTRALGVTAGAWWQVWRYVTFQFLHGDFWHIALNMLGLYMLGTPLENHWGPRRFTWFYLTCGVVAGVAYVAIVWALQPGLSFIPLIGASGGVFGIILACAVLFPHFMLILLFFPVPIRLAAGLIFGGMLLLVTQSLMRGSVGDALSDVAHLGGALAAAVWIWVIPRMRGAAGGIRQARKKGSWERKMRSREEDEAEIDRILDKIKRGGLHSLSHREKRTLQDATRRRREEDDRIGRL